MPKRKERVAPPPAAGGWDFRYANNATGIWASQDIGIDDFTNTGLAIAANGDIYIGAYNFTDGELQLLTISANRRRSSNRDSDSFSPRFSWAPKLSLMASWID